MPDELNTLTQLIFKYLPPIFLFLGTQVVGYLKIKWQVEGILKHINGIGAKVRDVEKKIEEYHIEEVLRHSHALEQIAYIKGELSGIYKPKPTNGQA